VIAIVSPARAVWFDLAPPAETLLPAGDDFVPPSSEGFLWVDLELPASEALGALAAAGLMPPDLVVDDDAAGRVSWTPAPSHLHLSLAGARLSGDSLELDRRHVLVADGAVISLHRGLPAHFDEVRDRYRDGFARFARSHGFLLYEMAGHLADGLQSAVRGLGDRIDELRLSAAGPAGGRDGSELLASVLLMRRILARTRDLLVELSSRRSPFVPETTQPFLRDMADRLDGLIADLAFSRDVLDEALRLTGALGAAPAHVEPARSDRPPVSIASLGGFEVRRGDAAITADELGGDRARELLAALLAARRPVGRDQLLAWLWPDPAPDGGTRALAEAVASLRGALGPELIAAEGSALRLVLGAGDSWDVDELLRVADGALTPERRVELLGTALEEYGRPFCPEWPHAEWGAPAREDCARALSAVRMRLAEELLGAGRADEAEAHFELLVDADPESEAAHRGLMRCHAEAGRTALALRQFHACRSVLSQTQGVEPSPETQALYLELLARR
jgi:DNA-binding SARP family transcriptional activator